MEVGLKEGEESEAKRTNRLLMLRAAVVRIDACSVAFPATNTPLLVAPRAEWIHRASRLLGGVKE